MLNTLNNIHQYSRALAKTVDIRNENQDYPVSKALIGGQEYEFSVKTEGCENLCKKEEKNTLVKVATWVGETVLWRTSSITNEKTKACLDSFDKVASSIYSFSDNGVAMSRVIKEEFTRIAVELHPKVKIAIGQTDMLNPLLATQNTGLQQYVIEESISERVDQLADQQAILNLKKAKTIGYISMATVASVALTALYLRNKK